ncbi:MAG: hypothetical protein NPMRTH1_1540003 [Nitrosopumilales archaeon]|nr:MAG: hypothetical protein NPMRTH1_1540003 [Nitrosopumilales archaeon]
MTAFTLPSESETMLCLMFTLESIILWSNWSEFMGYNTTWYYLSKDVIIKIEFNTNYQPPGCCIKQVSRVLYIQNPVNWQFF